MRGELQVQECGRTTPGAAVAAPGPDGRSLSGSDGGPDSDWDGGLLLEVTGRQTVAQGVVLLTLAAADRRPLPAWTPGAHIDLVLPHWVRHYSLCGDPHDRDEWQVAVLRASPGRGGSQHVHEELRPGSRIAVQGPRNRFELLPAKRYVFIAGGIGITPILPMIRQVEAAGLPWTLLYGGRSRASMAFHDRLAGYGDRVQLVPQDEYGHLPLSEWLADPRPDCLVYACGPEPMLAAVEQHTAGWPSGALRTERFSSRRVPAPSSPVEEVSPAAEAGGTHTVGTHTDGTHTGGFELVLQRSGRTLTVPPDRSILEVAEAAGARPLSACREGVCGTCQTRVLDGVPDHRDAVLDAAERQAGDSLMICVSRAASPRLVLDL